MFYQEALQILCLNNGFTLIELKQKYHEMLRKNHPDNFANCDEKTKKIATEKTQKIKDAYTYLKDNFGVGFSSQSYFSSDVDIVSYRDEKIKILKQKMNFSFSKHDAIPDEIKTEIDNFRSMMNFNILRMKSFNKKSLIDKDFQTFILPDLEEKFKTLKSVFFKYYGIDEKNVNLFLDYNTDLETFYETLLQIKENYSRDTFVRKADSFKGHSEYTIKNYILYSGYDCMKECIKSLQFRYIMDILHGSVHDTLDVLLANFDQEILDCFTKFYRIQSELENLRKIIYSLNDESIEIKFKKVERLFASISSCIILDRIEKLIYTIKEDLKEENYIDSVSACYDKLFNCYTNRLQQFQASSDLDKSCLLSENFNRVLTILQHIKNGRISMKSLSLLFNIDFNNFEKDSEILDLLSFSQIYVFNGGSDSYTGLLLGKLLSVHKEEEEVEIFGFSDQFPSFKLLYLSIQDFENSYITLENYLANRFLDGREYDLNKYVLYSNKYVSLYYHHGFGIERTRCHDFDLYRNISILRLPYDLADKNVMKRKLVEYLNDQLIDYEYSLDEKEYKRYMKKKFYNDSVFN